MSDRLTSVSRDEGPSCPVVCGTVSLVRWLYGRFPQAARAAGLAVLAPLLAMSYNALNPLGMRWLPTSDGRVGIPRAYESQLPQIDATTALALLDWEDVIFVDSRDREDYERDHVPGAVNVPMREWEKVWPKMKSQLPRDRILVLYCYGAHCGLSTRQGKRLLQLGYDRLVVLGRGWQAWTEAGGPTARHPQREVE